MAAQYTFEDLSGAVTSIVSDNPYSDFILACDDDAVRS